MASRIKGITAPIGGDTKRLLRSQEGVKNTHTQLKDVQNLLNLDPSST